MKRAIVLVAVLLLTSTMAWAEPAGTAPAPAADPRVAGGGCQLPDLAGLAPAQIQAAALNAGLEVTFAAAPAVPACPVTFHCNSIANCAAGGVCSVGLLGPCCNTGGVVLCCASGNISETRCACKCTGPLCAVSCVHSTEVNWNCV
jgi:hypothetical protein